MKTPIFVRSLSEDERESLQKGLRSTDTFTMRRSQILSASSRGERAPRIALLISAEIAKRSLVGSLLMDNSLSKEATDWREGRRLRAFELKQQGWSQQRIAEALGVSKGAVSQWMKRARHGGVQALKRQPAPGAPPRLSEEQRARVPELLERGAEAHGFRGEVWTCERVAIVIRKEFGVGYHPAHVSRLLKALRQSLQKPQRRANQRDEEAIERWKEERWPQLKKGHSRKAGP
jgi:transposase